MDSDTDEWPDEDTLDDGREDEGRDDDGADCDRSLESDRGLTKTPSSPRLVWGVVGVMTTSLPFSRAR
ncbi:MAG: hypothetical protein V4609_05480 [Pseudomonadota bacterium]